MCIIIILHRGDHIKHSIFELSLLLTMYFELVTYFGVLFFHIKPLKRVDFFPQFYGGKIDKQELYIFKVYTN